MCEAVARHAGQRACARIAAHLRLGRLGERASGLLDTPKGSLSYLVF